MGVFNVFSEISTASSLIFLALVGTIGIFIGRQKFFNIKLGIAGVLFTGIIIGHFGFQINHDVLHFVKEFGLILFVYSIGIEIGPRFMSSLRSNGLKLNGLAVGIVLLGFSCALVIKHLFKLDIEVIAGLLCGSVTNTPGLGAAQSIIVDQLQNGKQLSEVAGMAYAIAYPFGIIGILIVMFLVRKFFKVKINKEITDYQTEIDVKSGKARTVNIEVTNPNFYDKQLKFIKKVLDKEFVFSRILRNNEYLLADDSLMVQKGDVFVGICSEDHIPELELSVGKVNLTNKFEITGQLSMRHILMTNRKISGATIGSINLSGMFPANITRVFRGETEIIPSSSTTIEFGDTIRVVGVRDKMDEVAKFLGNSQKDLSHPNLIPLFIGVFLGILLGSIPVFIPGLPAPAKLGLAGGPLIIALILGSKGRVGTFDFYMTPSATLFIRELGIVLFLACVGIGSGKNFFSTIANGGYMWMIYGAMITFIPLLIIGIIARLMKINYLTICGLLSGSMTDPPALEFANAMAPTQAQASAYATVYPLTMFLRILTAQILILIFT